MGSREDCIFLSHGWGFPCKVSPLSSFSILSTHPNMFLHTCFHSSCWHMLDASCSGFHVWALPSQGWDCIPPFGLRPDVGHRPGCNEGGRIYLKEDQFHLTGTLFIWCLQGRGGCYSLGREGLRLTHRRFKRSGFRVLSLTIYNSQDLEAAWVSISRRMDKDDVIYISHIYVYISHIYVCLYHIYMYVYITYIHNGILLSHKKEGNNAIFSNMDATRDYHTKWSKSDRERQIYDIAYMWNLKKWYKWTYLQNRNRLTNI